MKARTPKNTTLSPALSAGYQVRRAHRSFDRLLNAHLVSKGLKSGYWYYLRVLWLRDGMTQRELSSSINVKETTTVTMIAGMQKAGLISFKRDDNDKRKKKIYLTSKSRALEKELMPIAKAINRIATKGVRQRDLKVFFQVLEAMNENIEAYAQQY